MNKRQRKILDKLLLNMLAKNPFEFRLIGSEGGWIKIKDIYKALREEGLFPGLTPKGIEQHILLFRPDGLEVNEHRARAVPALQTPGIFAYPPARPPDILFAAVRPRALIHVDSYGLSAPETGGWLALSSSRKEAHLLGKRFHDEPVLCKINAKMADTAGTIFRHAGGSLYLSEKIERQWIVLPETREGYGTDKSKGPHRGKVPPPKVSGPATDARMAGSFLPSITRLERPFERGKDGRSSRRSRKKFSHFEKKKKKR